MTLCGRVDRTFDVPSPAPSQEIAAVELLLQRFHLTSWHGNPIAADSLRSQWRLGRIMWSHRSAPAMARHDAMCALEHESEVLLN